MTDPQFMVAQQHFLNNTGRIAPLALACREPFYRFRRYATDVDKATIRAVLVDRCFRFGRPQDFHDPFDCCAHFRVPGLLHACGRRRFAREGTLVPGLMYSPLVLGRGYYGFRGHLTDVRAWITQALKQRVVSVCEVARTLSRTESVLCEYLLRHYPPQQTRDTRGTVTFRKRRAKTHAIDRAR